MSLTQAEQIHAGVHENGLNDFAHAFFTARPRYLNYGSPAFVAATTANVTRMDAIPFPGVPGGIQWAVSFTIPQIDLAPDSSGGTSPLPVLAGQLVIRTKVRLIVGCQQRNPRDIGQTTHVPTPTVQPLLTQLEVLARGRLVSRFAGPPGSGEISVEVLEVELVDITPDSLESVLECMIRMMLQAALSQFSLPIHALSIGAFQLALTRGPEVADDQVKLYGTL